MSILKNMYVIVQNNNVSISQNVGTSTNWYDSTPPNPPNYKDTSLRLTTVKKDINNDYKKIFEIDGGGSVDQFVNGNVLDGSTSVSNLATGGTNINAFRHAGAILPKNTIIPVISNYLFSILIQK